MKALWRAKVNSEEIQVSGAQRPLYLKKEERRRRGGGVGTGGEEERIPLGMELKGGRS